MVPLDVTQFVGHHGFQFLRVEDAQERPGHENVPQPPGQAITPAVRASPSYRARA